MILNTNYARFAFCTMLLCGLNAARADDVDFNRDIRPILSDKCFACHGPDEHDRAADLRLDTFEGATEDRDGSFAINPGSIEDSMLWQRIHSDDEDVVMPPPETHKTVTEREAELLSEWIKSGAEYQGHWAFIPPQKKEVPRVLDRFGKNPIDGFVYHQLQQAGLKPADRASKEILIRRVTFDLTGLPPTLAEVDAFLNDDSDTAYEKVIDRLLQSERFGERMTLDWMDAARYGDTSVFHADGPRDMWVWRDWVIDAYNNNLPFNEFARQQIAGDLLPNATWKEQVATGFLRNNASTDEGGAIAEEFRVEYAVDRVKTTSTVFLGISMECAQCHDHKYDPIPQKDYYRYFAYFNQAADPGMQTRNGNQAPIVEVPDEMKLARLPAIEQQLAVATTELKSVRKAAEPRFAKWLDEMESKPNKSQQLPSGLVAHLTLDETKGRNVAHAVGDAKATVKGEPTWGEGKVGGAFHTNASTFIDAGDVGDFESNQAFSYGCWFKSDGRVAGAPIARMHDGGGYRGYDIHLSGGALEMHLIHEWSGNAFKVSAPAPMKPKTWHHAFVTYDGSGKPEGVKLYLDGKHLKKVNFPTNALKGDTVRTKKSFTIGRRSNGSQFTGWVDDVRIYERQLSDSEVGQLVGIDTISPLLAIARDKRTPEQTQQLRDHYLKTIDAEFKSISGTLASLKAKQAELKKPKSTVMVMKDVPAGRMTYVLKRGQYDAPDKESPVEPTTPSFLPTLDNQPKNRLGLANWLVDNSNPLTARVTVNRFWKMFFGNGIVKTVEEFGAQGEWPSHPELLDWLAVDFQENGWDTKRLIKMMLMSETYQQSSRATAKQLEIDPENRLLSHGPRFRLQGEFVRDQALALSGLLVPTIGGPGVKPYQPEGLWNEVSLNKGLRFRRDSGEKLYRRSMYIYWKRSAPHPVMTIFDAPTREQCSVRRDTTNTPLQALALMNDPQFLEASRFLAERVLKEGGATEDSRLKFAYRTVTGRKPTDKTIEVMRSALAKELGAFSRDKERAMKLLTIGEKKRDESLDLVRHAAWTMLSSMLLNLDATVTRG
jgi:hypothetical protein